MSKRFHFSVLAVAAIAGISTAGIAMQTRERAHSHACLAIAQGVCFSGTMEWVAKAAEATPSRDIIMLAMVGDAF